MHHHIVFQVISFVYEEILKTKKQQQVCDSRLDQLPASFQFSNTNLLEESILLYIGSRTKLLYAYQFDYSSSILTIPLKKYVHIQYNILGKGQSSTPIYLPA
eukprot:TRINITY_DN2589_c3_g1_i1.p2 TRINITY_DN2589_c3_g1~~TRINITY_DN2589_c3_g1_i1.p2  ORF type:complete len:102 (+),score=1.19 TRINITY_DN2589_c3_g1_i1:462-767(+)